VRSGAADDGLAGDAGGDEDSTAATDGDEAEADPVALGPEDPQPATKVSAITTATDSRQDTPTMASV
jgi:hypothetical protein